MSAAQIFLQMPDFSQAQHIGDTENHKILHYEYNGTNIYGITVGEQVAGYVQTISQTILGMPVEELHQVYVEPQFRGQQLTIKLIFFLKSWLSKSFITGDIQSRDGQKNLQSLARTQRFPMFWINTQTGERHPYEPDKDNFTLKPYRSAIKKTDWRVLIEGLSPEDSKNLANSVPRFLPEGDWRHGIIWFEGLEQILQEEKERMAAIG